MGVRASQAYVSAVGKQQQDGELRVRRMYVDVLIQPSGGGILSESANNTLSLVSTAHGVIEEQDATSTLNITQNVTNTLIPDVLPSSQNLALSQNAVGNLVALRSASSTLSLTDAGARTIAESVNNVLSFVDTPVDYFNYVDDRKPAGNTLNFVQTVLVSSNPTAEQTLNLSQSVTVKYPYSLSVYHPLGLSQLAATPITYREEVEDALTLLHVGSTPTYLEITQNLVFVDEVSITNVEDTLNLIQTVSVAKGFAAENSFDVTQNVAVEGLWVRDVSQDLGIGHALTWYEDTPCGRKQYTPFQGENTITSDFVAPRNTLFDPQGDSDTFTFYTPFLGAITSQITLRKPEMDNRDRNAYTRINQETRGGRLIIFSDPQWPHVRTVAATVTGLTESEVDSYQSFVLSTLGQEIGMTDWEGRVWKGVITTPDEVAVQDGRNAWTISLEFEGEILNVEQPGGGGHEGQAMNLTQSATAVIV